MRWVLSILILFQAATLSACTQTPRRYGAAALPPLVVRAGPHPIFASDLARRSDQVGETINLVSEVFLRPFGLERLGETLYETNRFLRREVAEPIDRARRFQVRGIKGSFELDVDERLREFSLVLILRF